MSAPMRKHPTNPNKGFICIHHAGVLYLFPIEVAEAYRLTENFRIFLKWKKANATSAEK